MHKRAKPPGRSRWIVLVAAAATLIAAVTACGPDWWKPTEEQSEWAQNIAKYHVLQELSDQAGTAAASETVFEMDGETVYPESFTITRKPYDDYCRTVGGHTQSGRRELWVEFHDCADLVPDENGVLQYHVTESRPYFVVVIDAETGAVLDDTEPGWATERARHRTPVGGSE